MRSELLCLLALVAGCRRESSLTVLAAASVEEPLAELTGADVAVDAAASSVLARQIESGAPADLFVSADQEWAEWLAARVPIREKKVIARNRLVLVARSDDPRSADELLSLRLALADPTHVPAGRYAQASLQKLGRHRPEAIAAAADVRSALALVERGEADAGVVYRTDALLSAKVRIVSELESPTPIRYVAVLLNERARGIYGRLTSEEGRRVFERYGFLPP